MVMTQHQTDMTLSGDCTIIITRLFNAAPDIVFQAWTEAALVKRWWAPASLGVSMTSCEAEVVVGGRYRYVLKNPDGNLIAFSGEYLEIEPGLRLVYSQVFEPMADAGTAQLIVTFAPDGRSTRVVSTEIYPNAFVRDMVIASGMEEGMRNTMDQLATLVIDLAQEKVS
jgi:uncharacterized protein YndB with AHSA1/START domain